MYVAPDTNLIFIKNCPLASNLEHTILFESAGAQQAYFAGLSSQTVDKYSFQRPTLGIVRVGIPWNDCIGFNYMAFQNHAHGDKWFYAFITNYEYINEGCTAVFFQIDVLQTYMFDWALGSCFIERETPAHDVAGDNILEEGLATGEFYSVTDLSLWNPSTTILVGSTVDLTSSDLSTPAPAYNFDGIPVGYDLFGIDNTTHFNALMKKLNEAGKTDAIQFVTLMPTELINTGGFNEDGIAFIAPHSKTVTRNVSGRPSTFGVYEPHNKKLLTFPYNFLRVISSSGQGEIYKYEYFDNYESIIFNIQGAYSPNSGIRCVPQNYMGVRNNIHSAVTLTGYPLGSFNSNLFTNWFAQNKNSETYWAMKQGATMVHAGIQGAGAILNAGAAATGVLGESGYQYLEQGGINKESSKFRSATQKFTRAFDNVLTRIMAYRDMQTVPNAMALQSTTVDTSIAHDTYGFSFQKMQISPTYAIIIDQFFDRYGYKTNENRVPTLKNRPAWDFIKTADCDVGGNVPAMALEEIRAAFNAGITFWHNAATFGDYSQDNSV